VETQKIQKLAIKLRSSSQSFNDSDCEYQEMIQSSSDESELISEEQQQDQAKDQSQLEFGSHLIENDSKQSGLKIKNEDSYFEPTSETNDENMQTAKVNNTSGDVK